MVQTQITQIINIIIIIIIIMLFAFGQMYYQRLKAISLKII